MKSWKIPSLWSKNKILMFLLELKSGFVEDRKVRHQGNVQEATLHISSYAHSQLLNSG